MNIGVQLLKREKCCGVALIANGFMKQAKRQANVNLESLQETILENMYLLLQLHQPVRLPSVMNIRMYLMLILLQ